MLVLRTVRQSASIYLLYWYTRLLKPVRKCVRIFRLRRFVLLADELERESI